jgi:hypothetical protein
MLFAHQHITRYVMLSHCFSYRSYIKNKFSAILENFHSTHLTWPQAVLDFVCVARELNANNWVHVKSSRLSTHTAKSIHHGCPKHSEHNIAYHDLNIIWIFDEYFNRNTQSNFLLLSQLPFPSHNINMSIQQHQSQYTSKDVYFSDLFLRRL